MVEAGKRLRVLRETLGLTVRDVEAASLRIAAKHHNSDYCLPLSRLSDIETKGVVPSIFRLYSLSVIYRREFRHLLSLYGIDLSDVTEDLGVIEPRHSHLIETARQGGEIRVPLRMDPSFNPKSTTNIKRMVETWGAVPFAYLAQFEGREFTYAYIGTEDLTMYPLIMPGSFVQVDEEQNTVADGLWRSEYERPIYFIETRTGYACSWCAVKGNQIILQPHPLSPAEVRVMKYPQEAEVLGRVVGIAMQLANVQLSMNSKDGRASRILNQGVSA